VYYEKNKAEITALGKAYAIVTQNTSLIVLDNVADYADNEITPPKELLAEYNKIINDKSNVLRRQQADKTKMVRKNWQTRVDWWNKEFEISTPKRKYGWSNTADSTAPLNIGDANGVSESVVETALENFEIVEYEVPLISMDQTSSGGTITREEIRRMPGRSAASVNAAVGGVYSQEDGVNMRGSRSSDTDTYIDGVLQDFKGEINKSVKKIAIKEWQPNNAIFKELSEEKESTCYTKYLELKEANNDQATFYADAARVLRKKGRNKEALRVISNLAELELENHELLKVLANTLMEWKEIDWAVLVYAEILEQREEEPQSYRDLGLALHLQKKDQEAIEMLYQVVEKDWDNRFPEIENIVLGEINTIIANAKAPLNTRFMDQELIDHLPTGLRIVIDWDADNVDIDLWVTDPSNEKCFYSHPKTKIGGIISKDFTRGYGPEEFILKSPMKGKYKVEVNYYGSSQQRVTGPPTINAKLITNYGMSEEKVKDIVLRLKEDKEVVYIGELMVE
jgi:tetratricopeptide (TPR) repeat protein